MNLPPTKQIKDDNESERKTTMQITKQTSRKNPTAKSPETTPVEFSLNMPQARSVTVAGSFNNWSPARMPLQKTDQGVWRTTASLAAGRYEYRFVVDGEWLADPAAKECAPNPYGGQNSIKVVRSLVVPGTPALLAPLPTNRRISAPGR